MVCADLEQSGITARCPQLDIAPKVAMAQAQEEIDTALARGHRVRLIGSSLGGFFASALMEQHPQAAELKAALLNPLPGLPAIFKTMSANCLHGTRMKSCIFGLSIYRI